MLRGVLLRLLGLKAHAEITLDAVLIAFASYFALGALILIGAEHVVRVVYGPDDTTRQ